MGQIKQTKQNVKLNLNAKTFPKIRCIKTTYENNKTHYPNPYLFTSLSCLMMTKLDLWIDDAIRSFDKPVHQQLRIRTHRTQFSRITKPRCENDSQGLLK